MDKPSPNPLPCFGRGQGEGLNNGNRYELEFVEFSANYREFSQSSLKKKKKVYLKHARI